MSTSERVRLTATNAAMIDAGDRITVAAPDEVGDDVRFDRILSNPPIRIGKRALHDLLDRWLTRMTPDGVAHLVVQKHLGSDSLARWLEGSGIRSTGSRAVPASRILQVGARGNT